MGNITAQDLGLDLSTGNPSALYRWFLASLLFGRPVQQEVSMNTWRVLLRHGLTSPRRFAEHDREGLRAILDEGHYARIDYIMTDELHEIMGAIASEHGSVSALVKKAGSRRELEHALRQFTGIGPTTARIFLQDIPDDVIGSTRKR